LKPAKAKKDQQTLVRIAPVEVPVYSRTVLEESARLGHDSHAKKPLLVLQHNCMGHVDPPAGTELLAGLVGQMIVMEALPAVVILQGAAVQLAVDQNPVMDVLARMISLHIPVLICQESLKILNLNARLEGSRTVSQQEIAERMLKAEKTLWL